MCTHICTRTHVAEFPIFQASFSEILAQVQRTKYVAGRSVIDVSMKTHDVTYHRIPKGSRWISTAKLGNSRERTF